MELNIEDDKYFRTNHVEQLLEGLDMFLKYIELSGYCLKRLRCGVPYKIKGEDLWYNDKAIQFFFNRWVQMSDVDRTFYIIDLEKVYDEKLRLYCMYDMYHLKEVFGYN